MKAAGGVEIDPAEHIAAIGKKKDMLYVFEFELVEEGDGWVVSYPFDFEGATQGFGLAEASEMSADWLKAMLEHRIMTGESIPDATLGNAPKRGGRVLLVAVEASLETVGVVSAKDAAEMLGVTKGRVSQLLKAGKLLGYRKGRDVFVTTDSVNARLEYMPKKEKASV